MGRSIRPVKEVLDIMLTSFNHILNMRNYKFHCGHIRVQSTLRTYFPTSFSKLNGGIYRSWGGGLRFMIARLSSSLAYMMGFVASKTDQWKCIHQRRHISLSHSGICPTSKTCCCCCRCLHLRSLRMPTKTGIVPPPLSLYVYVSI